MKQKCFSPSLAVRENSEVFFLNLLQVREIFVSLNTNDTNLTNRFLLMTNHWFAFIVIKGFVLLED